MIVFGVGCFHFQILNLTKPRSATEYRTLVTDRLKQSTNISSVVVECEESDSPIHFADQTKNETAVPGDLQTGVVHPGLHGLRISFDLVIPIRVQHEVTKHLGEHYAIATEHFRVRLQHTYYYPIAIVECLGSTNHGDGSMGIIVVREFLSREFANDKELGFDFAGPSPFHVDFAIKSCAESSDGASGVNLDGFKYSLLRERGYDVLTYFHDQNVFTDDNDAFETLVDLIDNEIGFYYSIVTGANSKREEWANVESKFAALLSIATKDTKFGSLMSAWKARSALGELATSLTIFKTSQVIEDHAEEQSFRECFKSNRDFGFGEFVTLVRSEKQKYPIEELIQLVQFYESRATATLEIYSVLIAGLFGGVVGSAITALAK